MAPMNRKSPQISANASSIDGSGKSSISKPDNSIISVKYTCVSTDRTKKKEKMIKIMRFVFI
jgi:hypothetical protein